MRGFIGFTKRNLLIYFNDIQSVIFSMLTSIITFVLYLFFLKSQYVDTIEGRMQGLEQFIDGSDVSMLVNGLMLSGIIGSALITVSYNCLTTIIKDREARIDYDISATPMKRWQIILSYFTAALISAIIMTSIVTAVGLVVIAAMGDTGLTAAGVARLFGLIVLGAFSATALFMVIVLFFKSTSASGAFFGILSAASGFVIGAYIPVSTFSDTVETVCNIFPASHITTLIRSELMEGPLANISTSLGGVDNGAFTDGIRDTFVFHVTMFGHTFSTVESLLYVAALAVVSCVVMVVAYSKTYKR